MLRALLGEQPKEWEGAALEAVRAIQQFIRRAHAQIEVNPGFRASYIKLSIGGEGLLAALDELEESRYAARRFAERIKHFRIRDFSDDEHMDYARHIYFDKNAYIRVFSVLDKLGTLLNEALRLETQRMKSQYSYFTVLRNMREKRIHAELYEPLNELKEGHQSAMNRLRDRRNVEIHKMNPEMQDDLQQELTMRGGRAQLENIHENMNDLDEAWTMIEQSMFLSMTYADRWLRKKK